jgi:threonine dehydratase
MTKHLKPADYLKKILTARVYDVAVESALEPARNLSRRLHNKVLLKREDQQPSSASSCAAPTTRWRT